METAYEKQLSKLLSNYMRDLENNDQENVHTSLIDQTFELCQKWKPNLDKIRLTIRSLSDIVSLDDIPLTHQVYFLQSLANLEHLKASSASRAASKLLDTIGDLKQKHCWLRGFACCMIRSYIKQLDFTDVNDSVSRLSDVSDILKRSLAEVAGMRDHEAYRIICVTSFTELIIVWSKNFPNKISHTEAPSGPSRSLTPILGVLETNPISPLLRWTCHECLRRLVTVEQIWYTVSLGQRNSYLNLCVKSLYNYRCDKLDSVSLSLLISGLTNGATFLTALETPEYLCEVITSMLMILQPLFVAIKDDTRLFEVRFTCLRFLSRFICEFVPPISEDGNDNSSGIGAPTLEMVENYAKRFHSLCSGGNPAKPEEKQEDESTLFLQLQDAYGLYVTELGLGLEEAPRVLAPKLV